MPMDPEMEDAVMAAMDAHEARMAVLMEERTQIAGRLRELLQGGHVGHAIFSGGGGGLRCVNASCSG